MLLVGGVDGAEDIELDPMLAEKTPAPHDEVERALPLPVTSVGVVQLARPIDAEAYEKIVLLEEGAPGVVEQQAVGLEGLLDRLPRLSVFFDEFDRALEEFELHQGRLAPLPGDRYLRRAVGFQQLADIGSRASPATCDACRWDRALPSTERSNRRSRYCRSSRWAWRAGESSAAQSAASSERPAPFHHP